jgi:hypothetical protein
MRWIPFKPRRGNHPASPLTTQSGRDYTHWKSPGLTDTESEATVVISKSRCHVHIHLNPVNERSSWPTHRQAGRSDRNVRFSCGSPIEHVR